jgi:hypothetical protein
MERRHDSVARVTELRTAARHALREDRDAARRLALEALALLADLQASAVESADLHHSLAALFQELGDPARCESLALTALALEAALDRPAILGNHHLFLAMFLTRQGRLDEAAHHARAGLPHYERALGSRDPELARVRADIAAIIAAPARRRS